MQPVKLCTLIAAYLFAFQTFAQPLTYTISPVFTANEARLRVEVSFNAEKDSVTFLSYQDNQFGEPDQMNFLNLPPQMTGVTVTKSPENNWLEVKHPPHSRVRAVYEITDLQGSKPFYEYCCYKPIINRTYFHLQSGHLCAFPENYWNAPDDRKTVRFIWKDFPDEWTLHNSFGLNNTQTVTLKEAYFNSAVFVGGDFRRHRFEVKGKPVYFLTRSNLVSFTDDTLVSLLKKTVEGHRAFWNDFADSIYSVTFLPIDGAPWSDTSRFVSVGGSGLTNSFLSYGTNNPGLDYRLIRYIYVHELMHRWIGIKIENAQEEKQYWFSEGFTEYFTLKNMLRYGLINTDEWIKEFNDNFLMQHYASPNRQAPNDSLNYERFWSGDKEWEKLPYRRGCIYAFYLDRALYKESGSNTNLDHIMRLILNHMESNPGQKLDHTFFKKMVKRNLGKKGVKDFERFIEAGELIDFSQVLLPEGLEVKVSDRTVRFGPSKEVVTHQETYKNIPALAKKEGVSEEALKASILK